MAEENIVITYDTLFDLLRREKSKAELQKLEAKFFAEAANYILEKREVLNRQSAQVDLFAMTEKEKTEKQIESTMRIIKEIYEKREAKIIGSALNKSHVPAILIDNSVFLDEERKLFEQMLELMNKYREGVLYRILHGETPLIEEKKPEIPEVKNDTAVQEGSKVECTTNVNKIVRFKNAVPSFVGPELEEYGPFDQDEIANLPLTIAQILVENNRAEFIEEQ